MTEYIKLMAEHSKTKEHELIEECLDRYGVRGTRELTIEQAREFCRDKGILLRERNE